MTAVFAVLLVSLAIGGLLVLGAATRRPDRHLGPEGAEHWLVARVAERPRLRRVVAGVNRHVFGGASLAASLVVVTLAGIAVGSLFDSLDSRRGFAAWDDSVAGWGADRATATSTDVLKLVTEGGSTLVIFVIMAGVGLFDFARRRQWAVPGFLAATGIGIVIVNNTLKAIVDRDRPAVDHLVESAGSSFPSGHSAAAAACWAAIALVLFRHVPRRFGPLLAAVAVAIAGAVATSRALLGVHWLTDVIAGAVVGWAWFLLVAIAFGGRIVRLGEPAVELGAPLHPHLVHPQQRTEDMS